MAVFSAAETRYLLGERQLGRLATIDAEGRPHLVPLGWRLNEELGTIDITGRNFAATRKYRNVKGNPKVAFLVDDVLPPWRPRSVMVQGDAETIDAEITGGEAMLRVVPEKIISWGLPE